MPNEKLKMQSFFKSIFNFFSIIGLFVNVYAADIKLNKQIIIVSDKVKKEINNDFDHEHSELTEVLQKYAGFDRIEA